MTQRRRALTENAASPAQRKFAEHVESQRVRRRAQSLAAIMNTEAGRAFVWSELERHGVYTSPFDLHGTMQAYKIGRSDAGRELMAECIALDGGKLYLLMESEGRAAAESEQKAIDASHVQRSDAQQGDGE